MHQERRWYPIDVLCRGLRVSRAGYYSWLRGRGRKREQGNALLLNEIRRIYADNDRNYGSPRVYRELRQNGVSCSKERIERLMRDDGLRAKHARKYKVTTNSKHKLPVAPNVLAGRFDWERPNQAWVGDITFIATAEGWLYLAVLIDLFSRRIVGWAMDKRITRHLALRALHMAVQRRRPPRGLIHHTDQGSQYASGDYQKALKSYGMICSMSMRGRCWDNAVAESFFHTLKVELVYDRKFASREQAMSAIFNFMEVYYNTRRTHSLLDYVSPAEYERVALLKAA
ncbi:MAG: IS3 family transposase [Deferrisomatales bacterium]|nr:IS3 family transposase [Deferrisomatales bacterium]